MSQTFDERMCVAEMERACGRFSGLAPATRCPRMATPTYPACAPAPLHTACQAEAAAKAKAKEDLKAFLLSNEVNKKVMGGAVWGAQHACIAPNVLDCGRAGYPALPLMCRAVYLSFSCCRQPSQRLSKALLCRRCRCQAELTLRCRFVRLPSPPPCQIKEEEAERERLQDLEYMRQQAAQLWVAGEGAVALGRWNSLAAGRRGCGWQGRGPGWEGGAALRGAAGELGRWLNLQHSLLCLAAGTSRSGSASSCWRR